MSKLVEGQLRYFRTGVRFPSDPFKEATREQGEMIYPTSTLGRPIEEVAGLMGKEFVASPYPPTKEGEE